MKKQLALASLPLFLFTSFLLPASAEEKMAHPTAAVDPAAMPALSKPAVTQSDQLKSFFKESFDRRVEASPMFQSMLGIKKDYGMWDNLSEEKAEADNKRNEEDLAYLKSHFANGQLPQADQESYRVFEITGENERMQYQWRYHDYPLNQMFGWQAEIASFLITVHQIDAVDDAKAYISRLNGIKKLADQIVARMKISEQNGVIAPKFVFAYVKDDISNLLKGKPLDDSKEDNALWSDFNTKIDKLKLSPEEKADLLKQAEEALKTSFKQGYENLLAFATEQETRATTDDGAWKLPDGQKYYNDMLRFHTSTALTSDAVHELGLKEVARIHEEMRGLMRIIGFKGTLQEFFKESQTSEKFQYPNTDAGRKAYMKDSQDFLSGMEKKLPSAFKTLPKAPVVIRQVEKFREKSAEIGFYQQPSPDGKRPGYFYVNLYDMNNVPRSETEALVYHEAIPGHHMQISISQELENMPDFRKYADFTAYIEGWGLYSERLGKDMGFYQDPYSDFGRLTMELWRAIRLVVDTGIHAKKWTREQAIKYIMDNYPAGESEAVKAAERYIVMPGQATAYKVGMISILEARENAKAKLGDKFDLGEFHDVVLRSGPLPLNMMQENVTRWVEGKLKTAP